jgi:LmbE family N-acetylglucosaminyl deacetylase
MQIEDSYKKIFADKKTVMVVMAHPDDTEIFCGGLIARLINDGKKVVSVKMTKGDSGCKDQQISKKDLSEERDNEDQDSMKSLGVVDSVNLDLGDGCVENDLKTIGKVAYLIRKFKPDLVITHNPENIIISYAKNENWVNHRDHKNTGEAVVNAVYPYSRDLLFYPEQFSEEGIAPHKVVELLLVDFYNHPDEVFFDITDFFENRLKCLMCHKSQYNRERAKELAEFLTINSDGRSYERFRFVFAD